MEETIRIVLSICLITSVLSLTGIIVSVALMLFLSVFNIGPMRDE